MTRTTILILAALALMSSVLLWRTIDREYDALLLTTSLAGVNVPPALDFRPTVTRTTISYRINGRDHVADLYQPKGGSRTALVLAHGAIETGKDDLRLRQLAALLAGAKFIVLVPDIPNLRRLQLSADSAEDLVDAADYLLSRRDLSKGREIGIGAFSVAVSLALLAANNPRISEHLGFVLAVGGYYDFNRLLGYMTTGYHRAHGTEIRSPPNPVARWLIAMSNAAWLEEHNDRIGLTEISKRKLENGDADVDFLVAQLSPAGRAVYALLENTDRNRFERLLTRLPRCVREKITSVNIAEQDLSRLKADLILVHGMDDSVIPFTESRSLLHALPDGQASLYLLRGLQHVDIKTSMIDSLEMLRAIRRVVSQGQS